MVTDEWSNGPYHFWIDVLSRIMAWIESGGSPEHYTLALPNTDYMRECATHILEKLSIRFGEVTFMHSEDIYLCTGKITFISLPHTMGSNNTFLIKKIQDRVFSDTSFYAGNPKLKVYYFRKNRRRVVINDDEVKIFLLDKGFICTDFDDLSYLEAWRLMANTKLFIGIHGGGMTNIFFMPQGGTIVEFKTDNPNPESHCYWHLAHSLGHNYCQFIGESATPGNNTIEGSRGCDIRIEMATLKRWFEQHGI